MEAIHSATIAPAVPVTQLLRGLATIAVISCAGAFALLVATAFSDTIVRVAGGETADWGHFLGQFAMPSVPLVLALVLLVARVRTAASLAGFGGALLYLLLWVTVAF